MRYSARQRCYSTPWQYGSAPCTNVEIETLFWFFFFKWNLFGIRVVVLLSKIKFIFKFQWCKKKRDKQSPYSFCRDTMFTYLPKECWVVWILRKSQRDKEKPCIESQSKQYLWILYRNKFCLSFTGADVITKTRERKKWFLTYA